MDATTLAANAAMRNIVRRDMGEGYREFLTRLAKESGVQTPTRDDPAEVDKGRRDKAGNDDWQHLHDPDAKVAKTKDGATHLAREAGHAVDLGEKEHGAVLAVNVCDAAARDTATVADTRVRAAGNLRAVKGDDRVADKVSDDFVTEGVFDKGYHSKQVPLGLAGMGVRSYASEPGRGRQAWDGQAEAKAAVYANRRRLRGERGRRLLRSRGEKLERTFAHCYESGGMRRLHVRGRDNIAERALVHAAAFNLGLVMRLTDGLRKPRSPSNKAAAAAAVRARVSAVVGRPQPIRAAVRATGAAICPVPSPRRRVGRPGSAQLAA